MSFSKLGQIVEKLDVVIPDAKPIRIFTEGTGDAIVLHSTMGRMMHSEPMAALMNYMNNLVQKHAATEGESTRKILKKVEFYKYISKGEGDVENLPKIFGWFHKRFSRAASFLNWSVQGTFIDDFCGYYAELHEPLAEVVPKIDPHKMKEVQDQRLAFDSECNANEIYAPDQKPKKTSGLRVSQKTEASILYEELYAIIENVNSLFVDKIASGEFEEFGIRMNADEYEDRFEEVKGDIARILGSDQEHHFSNCMFDKIDFAPVFDKVRREVFRDGSSGAIYIAQQYVDMLSEYIKDEFA